MQTIVDPQWVSVETLASIGVGLGLAAATGLRVFVPLLIVAVAARLELFDLAEGFEWLASAPAVVGLAAATAFEILAYYVPWFDNLLDALATPAALLAGTLVSASVFTGLPPWLAWALALVAGGGAASLVQGATATLRLKSLVTTGGLANPAMATAELAGSIAVSLVTILVPLLVLGLAVLLLGGVGLWLMRRRAPAAVPPSR
jgi:hypothetical protein